MKLDTDTKWHKFLELANTPRGRLPELIKSSEVDMAYGFSVEELLPSVEYVWDTLRFLLHHMTIGDSEGEAADKTDTAIRVYGKIHIANLEALTDPPWKEKLPYSVSCNFTVVSHVAQEAAEAFVEWCRMPSGERPRFVRRHFQYFAL